MVNFLTDDFFWRDRLKKIGFACIIILLALGALVADRLLGLYLENKELEAKIEIVEEQINAVEKKEQQIEHFREEKEEIEREVEIREQQAAGHLSLKQLMEELSGLSFPRLHLTSFEVESRQFRLRGVSGEMSYLNQLISQLEEADFFSNYHLESISEEDGLIRFTIRGEVRGGRNR